MALKSAPSQNTMPRRQWVNLKRTKQIGDLEKKLDYYQRTNKAHTFNFLSSRPSEGVSTIVTNLAEYMASAKADKRILLIDANINTPVIHRHFERSASPGLRETLSNLEKVKDYIVNSAMKNLKLLTCGNLDCRPDSINSLDQGKFQELTRMLESLYDYVLIDSTPLLASSESLVPAIASDVTYLVIQARATQKAVAEKAIALLSESSCTIGGVILNRDIKPIPGWLYKRL